MGLIYHAALENSLIICFMDSRLLNTSFGISPVSRREQNEVDEFYKSVTTNRDSPTLVLSLALNGGGRIFHSPSSPLFSMLALLYCLIYWETLSARLSKLKDYGFDQLVSQRNWHHLLDKKPGFWGTCLPWRNVRSWLHDGRVGEVADSVSSGSFRGGHRRYLPIRNHDNRSSADWIRLCPGLSKNSENGNSCPKPHKAARHDWSSGKSGQHWDWDY